MADFAPGLVTVFGGSGFVGTQVVRALAKRGWRVRVAVRKPALAYELRMAGDVGQIQTVRCDITDKAAVAEAIKGADAVINLVGILHSRDVVLPYSRDFAEAHVELPKKIVAACKAAGVRRLVHMSALNADPKGTSEYLRSKGDGEAVVLAAQGELDVTVFRPSVIFGLGDSFLSMFAAVLKKVPFFPLGFGHARFQPVWAADVADAFVDSLRNPETFGQAYDLVGPKVYTLRELVQLAGRYSGHPRPVFGLPPALARMQAWFLEHAPGGPLMSRDNLDSMRTDNVGSPDTTPMPTAPEDIAPFYLGDQPSPFGYDHTRRRG